MAESVEFAEDTTFNHNHFRRHVGVEFEVASMPHVPGRVRKSEHCGWEILSKPARGDALLRELKYMCRHLDGHPVTKDCGGHIHVDCSDYTWNDMARLLAVWKKVEDALYDICPTYRAEGTFSQKTNPDMTIHNLVDNNEDEANIRVISKLCRLRFDTARSSKRAYTKMYDHYPEKWVQYPERYLGMNIQPWLAWDAHKQTQDLIPTVEFRFPPATVQYERVRGMALLLVALVEYAKSNSLKSILAESGGIELLLRLAPRPEVKSFVLDRYDYYLDNETDDEWTDASSCVCNCCDGHYDLNNLCPRCGCCCDCCECCECLGCGMVVSTEDSYYNGWETLCESCYSRWEGNSSVD
jgi:hypothetical protein